jgi:histidyl-tRNA synthetase
VAIVGSDELVSGKITLKDMVSGSQEQLDAEALINRIS